MPDDPIPAMLDMLAAHAGRLNQLGAQVDDVAAGAANWDRDQRADGDNLIGPGGDARPGSDRRYPRPGQRDLGLPCRRHDHRADNRGVPHGDCGGRARCRRLRRGACPRETTADPAVAVKFKLDENLPVSAASVLADAGHDVDTVPGEDLTGRPDQDVVTASTAAGRVLISLDVGLGDIRAYPPGSHAGVVIASDQRRSRHSALLAGLRNQGRQGAAVEERGRLGRRAVAPGCRGRVRS